MKYFRDPDGDYLALDYSQRGLDPRTIEGRAPAVQGLVSSVCTTAVSYEYLNRCEAVTKKDVPKPWLRAIEGRF